MRKKGRIFSRRGLKLLLGLVAAAFLVCRDAPRQEISDPTPLEPTLSVNEVPVEDRAEIDGDMYLPYYKAADLPELQMTPLELPDENPVMEIHLEHIQTFIECYGKATCPRPWLIALIPPA